MATKFPIIDVTKASLLMPLSSPINVLKAIGLIILAVLVGAILLVIALLASGVDFEMLRTLPERMQSGDFSGMSGVMGLIIGYFLMLMMIIVAAAHIFNYWVRFAAFGKEGAEIKPFGRAVSAALVNGLKFLLIGLLIVLISMIISFVLSSMGLSSGMMEQLAMADAAEQYRAGFASTLISTVAACFVYSVFSANLTQTAIGSDEEGLQHPHAIDFAVVLMLVYAVVIIPTTIAALIGSTGLVYLTQFVFGIFVMFAIPAAHGLRYRICAKENITQVSEDPRESQSEDDGNS